MRARVIACVLLAACGGGGDDDGSTNPPDAARIDAPVDSGGLATTCEGACRTTALTATFGSVTRQLDRAYYGVTTGASGTTLHVEAYRGGGSGCPTQNSPTPDYTLILGKVVVPSSTSPSTSPGNILDFVGDLLGGELGAAATAVTVTPVAADVCATCSGILALDVSLTFSAGTVAGHLFATHCASLDSQE